MSKGKVWAIIAGAIMVGLLGAAVANVELWGAFALGVAANFLFWVGYSMGHEDAEGDL